MSAPSVLKDEAAPNRRVPTAWLIGSRQWAREASRRAGVPPPLILLPTVPILANPTWQRAPSFAAAAALLVPPCDCPTQITVNGRQGAATGSSSNALHAGDLAAAVGIAAAAGWFSRALWLAGSRDAFFVSTMPYMHVDGLQHRQKQLFPVALQLMAEQEDSSGEQPAQEKQQQQCKDQHKQAIAIFREIAADQRPGALRLLGWLLSHLFRWLFNSEVYVDTTSLQRLRHLYHQQPHQQQGGTHTSACNGGGPLREVANGPALPAVGARTDALPPATQQQQQQRACLVYIPAHKSHLDYLMLSFILFACGLPCPHIAAGANLSLPLVGRVLRACGAFFIRRTSRGAPDAHAYKSVLAAYVHAMLAAGHHLEFFIEGGRSRDGRVNPPKLGMLRMVVDAVLAGHVDRPVYLVPTAMNYDALLEERSLAAQLAGASKQRESLGGLLGTCWGIVAKAVRMRWQRRVLGLGAGGYCGRATVSFGQPISLQSWLQENRAALYAGGSSQRRAMTGLGELITASIRTTSVIPTSALMLGALFAQQHVGGLTAVGGSRLVGPGNILGLAGSSSSRNVGEAAGSSAAAAVSGMHWLAGQLEQRGAAVVSLPHAPPDTSGQAASGDQQEQQQQERLLLHLASMLPRCCSVSMQSSSGSDGVDPPQHVRQQRQQPVLRLQRGIEAALMQHSRLNQLLPWLAGEGLVVAALLGAGDDRQGQPGADKVQVLEAAVWLRCLLAPDMDTALGPGTLCSAAEFEAVLQRLLGSGALVQEPLGASTRVRLAGGGDGQDDGRRAALLAAALLAPLLSTYGQALRAMQAVLADSGPAGSSSKALCSAAQKRLLALAAASPQGESDVANGGAWSSRNGQAEEVAVPSIALVQGALKSFAALGVLVAVPAPAAAQSAEAAQPQPGAASAEVSVEPHFSSGFPTQPSGVDVEYVGEAPPHDSKGESSTGSSPSRASSSVGQPPRRSLERRRPPPRSPSRSGSDSEQDPAVADSVAANLCTMDGGSNTAGSNATARDSHGTGGRAEGFPAPVARAAAAAAAACDALQCWALGQPKDAVQQLADRIESYVCTVLSSHSHIHM